jgi:predicted lactoylglutathione lyase
MSITKLNPYLNYDGHHGEVMWMDPSAAQP